MARFISRFGKPSIGIRTEIKEFYATGQSRVLQRGLEAKFENGLVTPDDIERAFKYGLVFNGRPEDTDTEQLADVRPRMSVFDSEKAKLENGWTDEEYDLVLAGLRSDSQYGKDYFEVVQEPAAKPWPKYDELETPEEIVTVALGIGVDLGEVIRYEIENRNAAAVVNALEEAKAEVAANEVVISA